MTGKKNVALWGSGFLALAYLLALGYMASLLTTGTPSVATIIALAVLGIGGFAILLFGIAVAFRGMDALDPQHAFGLPRGTVRAILALGLLVAFLAGSFYWIDRAATQAPLRLTQQALAPGADADLAEVRKALGSEIAVFWTTEKKTVVENGVKRQVDVRTLNFVDRAANQEWLDLIKQVITVLSTSLAAVVGFYFGSRSSDTSHKAGAEDAGAEAEAGKVSAQIESARELMAAITTDVQRAKNAADKVKATHDAAKKSDADGMATMLLASTVENAEKAYANALDLESKARALITEIEEATTKLAAKATTAEQAVGYREQIATALKTLKQQSMLAQAAGDRAQKLAGWSEPEPEAPQPQTT
jgi:hypothetical protein